MPVTDAPTGELGTPGTVGFPILTSPSNRQAAAAFGVDSTEDTPDLRFPLSAYVYDRMRRTDGQVGSVLSAINLAILGARWHLAGDDVRPEVMTAVSAELGLNTPAGRARRRRHGIVWRQHCREALLSLVYGFYPFEQSYQVGPPLPGVAAPPGTGGYVAHIHKLSPRPPRTLTDVTVAADGGLAGIIQTPRPGDRDHPHGVPIPVDRLVYYCHDREGADWYGNSILRTAYPSWLIKDHLRRLGPMVVERNGMGVPVVTYPENGSRARALEIAKAVRAGDEAGAAMPAGYTLTLLGVTGTLRDELPLLKYHDEEIGRSALAMFLNLGHDNGARALGDTFVNYFLRAGDATAEEVGETTTEHVIRDYVEHNYGPDEPYPLLVADRLDADAEPTAEALAALAEAGLLTPDPPTEDDIRRRHQLPPRLVVEGATAEADKAGVQSVGVPALITAGVISPEEGRKILGFDGPAPDRVTVDPVGAGDDGTYAAALTERLETAAAALAAMRRNADGT